MLTDKRAPEAFSVRISHHQPIAKNQWLVTLKSEKQALPSFDPGNFCMLSLPQLVDPLLPRPFAIVESSSEHFSFIYRVSGKQTQLLTQMPVGAKIGMLGPLGKGIDRKSLQTGQHIFIAGGVGYASLLPLIDSLSDEALSKSKVFYGVREDLETIRRGKIKASMASDDGSIGIKGRITELFKTEKFSSDAKFYVCGPSAMMRACYPLLPSDRSLYFLEENMGCGFGICVGCVVSIRKPDGSSWRVKSCIDGPMFLGAQLIDWAENKK